VVRGDENRKDIPIRMWVGTQSTLEEISNMKARHILNEEHFNKRILNYYAPYFEDLKECSNKLRCLFTASDIDVTHNAMLVILHRTFIKIKPEYDSEGWKDHTAEDKVDMETEEEVDDEDEVEDIKVEGDDGGNGAEEDKGEEEEEDKDDDDEEDDMIMAQSGLDLNLRPLCFLPHTNVTCVPPQVTITTYPFGRACSSSPCPQYTHALSNSHILNYFLYYVSLKLEQCSFICGVRTLFGFCFAPRLEVLCWQLP
jgi:hypothetical protein